MPAVRRGREALSENPFRRARKMLEIRIRPVRRAVGCAVEAGPAPQERRPSGAKKVSEFPCDDRLLPIDAHRMRSALRRTRLEVEIGVVGVAGHVALDERAIAQIDEKVANQPTWALTRQRE